jgi:hypothetical protein
MSDYPAFKKIPRLFRPATITEKIDGSNALVYVSTGSESEVVASSARKVVRASDGVELLVSAGSRNRWLSLGNDNYGFCAWVHEHANELATLGPGHHYGEWWGRGINRHYGLIDRRFSLFNVRKYRNHGLPLQPAFRKDWLEGLSNDPYIPDTRIELPECVSLVPTLAYGTFSQVLVDIALTKLILGGSFAKPGFPNPEGVVVYHEASNQNFKVLIENDDKAKGEQ